jgi:hypothetical protein
MMRAYFYSIIGTISYMVVGQKRLSSASNNKHAASMLVTYVSRAPHWAVLMPNEQGSLGLCWRMCPKQLSVRTFGGASLRLPS